MIDTPLLVRPGTAPRLDRRKPDDAGAFAGKGGRAKAEAQTADALKELDELQERLFAGRQGSVLVILQAIDAGGKDGTIRTIFRGINPQGCVVTGFGVPSPAEAAHDFLWRHHAAVPPRGMIGIHNRSHYEAVLVERVKGLVPESVWRPRYEHINAFESLLADAGTAVVKVFLHLSKAEQKKRFEDRLSEPDKHWKFNPADLAERERWDEYQAAFEGALRHCSTDRAPWYVVPADRKWFRNWAISDLLLRTMRGMDLRYPDPPPEVENYKVV